MFRVAGLVCLVALGGACRQQAAVPADAASARDGAGTARAAAAAELSCSALSGCVEGCGAGGGEACAEACVRRIGAASRPYYDALQACVVPACARADAGEAPCRAPSSFACKMCVLARCPTVASACMAH